MGSGNAFWVYFFKGPGIGHSNFNLGAGEDIRGSFPPEGFPGIDPIHPLLHEPLAYLDSLSFFLGQIGVGKEFNISARRAELPDK
jgi:hypothetical protein